MDVLGSWRGPRKVPISHHGLPLLEKSTDGTSESGAYGSAQPDPSPSPSDATIPLDCDLPW